MEDKELDKLTPIELHNLFYKIYNKLKELPYVYNEEKKVTHSDYFVSNKVAYYDERKEYEI